MALRVMQRDGSAPTVNQISVRTVLRLIERRSDALYERRKSLSGAGLVGCG
jgi:hypothetical protein